ncbi:MAG TPA: putative toxin-antitoxin system toxin component, PIN family [Deltaproteobacteria bacterium]|nr:putative toxin-antitoxin system toxin component, PIN family [Deltaproteobacteria bacterium]
MRIVLDTNVLISGIFFSGPPSRILEAWRDGRIELAVSPDILSEYQRVGNELSKQFPSIDLSSLLGLVTIHAMMFQSCQLSEPVCEDPDDDMFIACAIASKSKVIVSGDKHLLNIKSFGGITILKPREFVDTFL